MTKLLDIKQYSLNAKVIISLFSLALFLLIILFSLIVPKIQEDQYKRLINEIEQVLSITQEQIKVAGKAIMMQSNLEVQLNQKKIELELHKIKSSFSNSSNIDLLIKKLSQNSILKANNFAIKTKDSLYVSSKKDIYKDYKLKEYNKWEEHKLKDLSRNYVYYKKYFFYTLRLEKNLELTIFASKYTLNKNHTPFEKDIKQNVQKAFNTTTKLHEGKTYLIWMNSRIKDENTKALFSEDKKIRKERYTLSKMSNVQNISTGNLSAKEVFEARNKKPISHILNNEEAITWVRDLSEDESKEYIFLLVKTLYKKDLSKQVDSVLLKILPASLISFILVLVIAFFLFKRLFKSINTLTNTAKQINKGDKSVRSFVKGDDDIGTLGIAFDKMIDNFENSIDTLDKKVEEKTKELTVSLEEKETLLKEIHHRVKNNLALTISLIKLQQSKIDDENTIKTLNDIQERIYTMELLHRKLYESSNLNAINIKEYIHSLVNDISTSYDYEKKVAIEFKVEEFFFDIQKAIPCALIINELVTNTYKYAFENTPKAKLYISLFKEKDNYVLIVKDNGKGIDKKIDVKNSQTLGLKLINSICTLQLHGKVEYISNHGAMFKITF
ncbi:histidine kinase dimerization/phosphoacceptor domain -containing protein [Arcobacter roscoffensis]|uniref:histidine kinase n=1 Tax=Arcobacter roscoffensis TaxID=2961520 RepID=A0ABY5E5M6_9BACT|nr:histidine kinase dimerization/phosphoacceptor domain -containing protein [Arcobacter roscoffensis]UTJ07162.1 HAMP domain-containing protein [Arcobacter roscoffensis]